MAWEGSTRRERLPDDWQERRIRVLRRDGYRCQVQDESGIPCLDPAGEVDHVERGDDHRLTNLQAICVPCHKRKTAKEANDAKPKRRRPREPHPGLR